MSYIDMRGAVGLTHLFLRERVALGDRVVDATCGNGQDTLFLARLVGPLGMVWAFDVQEEALAKARTHLSEAGCLSRVKLLQAGHEQLAAHVEGPVQAVVFNLGYLPGSDKACITLPETTLAALKQSETVLFPGGIIVIAVYTGHPGGREEGAAVEQWVASLPYQSYSVWCSRQINRPSTVPYVIVVEKLVPGEQCGQPHL
ncbi:tRNA (mnm(5)s(2)U34)-methyltransferase [Geotalea uraniireducens]|uniref:Putative rRNA methylase n=1 Tax=Geotalea uraniireducens (strain Rf4) TaxID=351605 RepID=A5GB14_GEOUR|nr:class I SAM-dependent methyltransferase [Geotalea uraniireducens]ABQ25228.1 putative rRNA methylase [Geotalea uraniireducens Rf4]